MHPPHVKQQALELIAAGENDCQVSRRIGVPRSTIREWRRPVYRRLTPVETCLRCWQEMRPVRFSPDDYSELLAMYLGDGCISVLARTSRLRISLDTRYPQIIDDARRLLERCFPMNRVDTVPFHDGACVNLSVYCSHLPCLFPQHGPGKKHERQIVLEPWQLHIIDSSPWPFVRGCIRTDGCAFVNRTGPYEYLSYDFSNNSEDIIRLFVRACDRVGVCTRVNCHRGQWDVRINQRPSVALMVEHVGLKS